jgi:acyl-CoA thioester hydrolase
MDAYGHVNNAMFFRYFETARIAFLDRCGFLASYDQHGIGAILHSTDCRFRRALVFPDEILVGTRTLDVAGDRFTMGYRIVSLGQDAVAADGTGIVVAYDYHSGTKVPLPGEVRRGVEALRPTVSSD